MKLLFNGVIIVKSSILDIASDIFVNVSSLKITSGSKTNENFVLDLLRPIFRPAPWPIFLDIITFDNGGTVSNKLQIALSLLNVTAINVISSKLKFIVI